MTSQSESVVRPKPAGDKWVQHIQDGLKDEQRSAQNDITHSHRELSRAAQMMRGLLRNTAAPEKFWDMVVISAGDETQKQWYEKQLQHRQKHGTSRCQCLIPKYGFRVFSDPNGERVGDGGSTLHILASLKAEFGTELESLCILLIHAGGYSKRLPQQSCSAKLFSPLPIKLEDSKNEEIFHLLDAKLVMYLPFLELMGSGGVFCTASDDLEGYYMSDADKTAIKAEVADLPKEDPVLFSLAHPSTLFIGTGHGCFLLDREELRQRQNSLRQDRSTLLLQRCLEVLQKPTIENMRKKGLVVSHPTSGEEIVYTDSAYWLNSALVDRLCDFYEALLADDSKKHLLKTETSVYSDFMTCQGLRQASEKEFCQKVWNGSCGFRKEIVALMSTVKLQLLLLPESTFYHIGTLSEYIDAFCRDRKLQDEFGFRGDSELNTVNIGSEIGSKVALNGSCVLEYSSIQSEVTIGSETIISGCMIDNSVNGVLPARHVYHTAPIRTADGVQYVTIAFALQDDLKAKIICDSEVVDINFSTLHFRGVHAKTLFLPKYSEKEYSLWNCRIFPLASSMPESFVNTLAILRGEKSPGDFDLAARCSMDDLISSFDGDTLLQYKASMKLKSKMV